MNWKELVGLVEQVFDDVVGKMVQSSSSVPNVASRFMNRTTREITFVPVASSISRKCKNFREKKKSA